MSKVNGLVKRYMMSHYNMTALECVPKKLRPIIIDSGALPTIIKQMNKTRLISKTEFNSLCKHMGFSMLPKVS